MSFSKKFGTTTASGKKGCASSLFDRYDCIAFDVGGVFEADTWETIMLTPGRGIADRLGIDKTAAQKAGAECWEEFAHKKVADEEDYWKSYEAKLGTPIDRKVIAEAKKELIWTDPTTERVVAQAQDSGKQVAIVSNSTPFFFEHQMEVTGLTQRVKAMSLYLSHELGVPKTKPGGGLEKLTEDMKAKGIPPEKILFIDDRESNVKAARKLGMHAVLYTHGEYGATLHESLEKTLRSPVPAQAPGAPRPG